MGINKAAGEIDAVFSEPPSLSDDEALGDSQKKSL
jgi:hypothetical protein